jgi:hypothetical protein
VPAGYASWRTVVWSRWPVAGPRPFWTSREHYEATVAVLHEVGAVVDAGTIFWDVRPSSHLPTLEVRMADVRMTADETAMFAALVRALAVDALGRVDAGDPGPAVPAEMLRLAYWRAVRDGAAGHGIDPLSGRLLPVSELAGELFARVRPVWGTAVRTRLWPVGCAGSWPVVTASTGATGAMAKAATGATGATARPGSGAPSPRAAAWPTWWTCSPSAQRRATPGVLRARWGRSLARVSETGTEDGWETP